MEPLTSSASANIKSRKARSVVTWSTCGEKGHTKRTCLQRGGGQNKAPKVTTTKLGRLINLPRHLLDEIDDTDSDEDVEDEKELTDVLDIDGSVENTYTFKNLNDERVVIDLTAVDWKVEEKPTTTSASTARSPEFVRGAMPGSNIHRGKGNTVVEMWSLFFTDEVLKIFVDATNAFAVNSRCKHWSQPLTIKEFKKFLGALYLLGLNDVPQRYSNLCYLK